MVSSTSGDKNDGGSIGPRQEYHDPFFDMASLSLPSNIKSLFRYSRYYFYAEPIVGAVIRKMAQYPVTDLIIEHKQNNEDAEKKWDEVVEKLKLKSFLISMGLDYFTYGNCFFTPYLPIIRMLICPECKNMNEENDAPQKINIDDVDDLNFKDDTFEGKCPHCERKVSFEVHEKPQRNIDKVNFIRWNPLNINIDYNPITGHRDYYYDIPNEVQNNIVLGKTSYLETVPMEFIKAAHENKPVKLSNNMIYHMKRETIAQTNAGWGRPLTYNVLKYLYYLQTLRKAQEVVAVERSVPFRYLFPSSGTGQSPLSNYDGAKWRENMQQEIEEWKTDPGHISLMPFPVEEGNLGGDAKALMLTPEINNVVQNAITGMGVPQEFIYGGMQWTGSSVSLRMIENKMLNFRTDLNLILDFIQEILEEFLGLPEVNIKLKDFKMADDTQRKQLAMKLNQANKISDSTLLNELGYDPQQERNKIMEEIKESEKMMQKKALASARLQGIMAKIKGKYKIEQMRDMKQEQMDFKEEIQTAKQAEKGGIGESQAKGPQAAAKQVSNQVQNPQNKQKVNQIGQQVNGQLDQILGGENGRGSERERIIQELLDRDSGQNAEQ